jgi:predicted ester cyclase
MTDHRARLRDQLHAIAEAADPGRLLSALAASDNTWNIADPVGALAGADAVARGWFAPLRAALAGLRRRDEIVMGGQSRTGSGTWVATLGHYLGDFTAPLFGIPPSGRLAFLRCGEFYRLDAQGHVAAAFLLPDVVDLARQAGLSPLPSLLGNEHVFPGPATHDGVLPSAAERSARSAALVEAMLADLHAFEPATFASAGQTGTGGYWHRDMLWYGPSGVGANFRYDGFQRDHRIPFLTAFPDRKGGNHFARFGDGDYVCSGGWPSMTMTHRGPYLGEPATGRAMTLRVMDFWRVQDGSIRENWVLLDLVHLFRQMGRDILPTAIKPS